MPSRFRQILFLAAIVSAVLIAPYGFCAEATGETLDPIAGAAPDLLLAKEFGPEFDCSRFLISEKFDGVRAYWDGKVLRFRSGQVLHAPGWFLAKLPPESLDGELWLGRGQFERLSGIVRKEPPSDAEWRELHYLIFELPHAPGSFAERAQRIQAIVARVNWPQLVAVEQFRVNDRAELDARLAVMVKAGAEGLMLHRADAPYETGRSDALLKLKLRQDAEAVVIEHLPGKGKFEGMLGSLRVKTPGGRVFAIGTGFTDKERAHPPPLGSTVTYTYRGLTKNGLPRFPSFLRIRQPGL